MSYRIVWKYKIRSESKQVFETAYGSTGVWSELFSKSENYTGSFLHKDATEDNTYLLIDTWTDQQSYEDFKSVNSEEYNGLSKRFETLYETEELIGLFTPVTSV